MTPQEVNELALDYAAEWYRRYDDRRVHRPQKWILNLVAKSMIKAYKKGFNEAKRRYSKQLPIKQQFHGIKFLSGAGDDDLHRK